MGVAVAAGPRPGISVSGLSFRYPSAARPTLRDVSFEVAPGQVLGVLGANGSGKSTLLNALLDVRAGERRGTVAIQGGRPDARGRPDGPGASRARRAAAARDVGYAPQQVALYDLLTVRENLRHVARTLLGRRAVTAAVDDAIAEHGLEPVASTPAYRLSGGWRRLAHIAASFVHRPGVRLLDEPTAALDFEARRRLVELVQSWRAAGIPMIVTSHYPEDIDEICTHALVISDGAVARHGPLADLLGRCRRELVIEAVAESGAIAARADAPATPADLAAALGALVARSGEFASARLLAVRVTDNRLRDVLAADPRLKGLLDDEA